MTAYGAWAWPEGDPPRKLADRIRRETDPTDAVTILGFPDDAGVVMNGGRAGAADGPRAFRGALLRYGTARPAGFQWPGVVDAGDVEPAETLTETHRRASEASGRLVEGGALPVGIGGGHDFTYALVRGVAQGLDEPLTGIYLDAHLDVRPTEGSGMSFRRLVDEGHVGELHVHGLDPYATSPDHLAWFTDHGGDVGAFGPEDPWPKGPLFVSIDLDALDQAFAPGVSAANPCGLTPREVEAWARAAGRHPGVRCFDLMELSPRWDQGGRTARLAARLFLAFLHGVAERAP